MSDSVQLTDLQLVSRDLWKLKSHLRAAWRHAEVDSMLRRDVGELQKVVDVMHEELFKLIARERAKEPNQRNVRRAEDFALKAQLAKAREAVVAVVKDGVLTHSHK